MKNVLILLLSTLLTISLDAQQNQTGKLLGRIVDAKNNKGIEAASVQLFRLTDNSLTGGMLTKPNGDFDISNISLTDSFKLEVTAIGYAPQTVSIFFGGRKNEKDLGNIKMTADAKFLSSVTITAQKPALQMGIDRKLFDVEKSLVSTGGTGIDVMRNIPSVSVDVDGNVLLRNNSPQIFVDGRPSILSLDQIPADNIERVELITNPSAKFDAASTGGIINVILKKNKKLGMIGIVSGSIGSPKIANGNLGLNLREGKFNVFLNGNYNQSGGRAKSETYRTNKDQGVITDYFNQYSFTDRMRRFGSIRFGFDYFMDNRNTLTLTQNFAGGRFTSDEDQHQDYFTAAKQLDHYGTRTSDGLGTNRRSNTQLVFKHNFLESGKTLSADVNYNYGKGNDESNILNRYLNPDGTDYAAAQRVLNDGNNKNNQVTVQVDFVDPHGENEKLEAGLRTYINDFTGTFNAFSNNGGVKEKLPLSNNYTYTEMVNAAYMTYTGKLLGIGYQAGLRAEYSEFDGEQVDSAKKFGYKYPEDIDNIFNALFPSLYLTKELGHGQEIQLNYSRRIRRPDFWQLNPFIDINDPFNIRQGNPNLKPEFTNSFEFNYNKTYDAGSFLGVAYFRNSQGDFTRYSDTITTEQYQKLNNAAVDPSAILNTFINAEYENDLGAELTLQQKIGKHFDFTPSANLQYKKVKSGVNDQDLSNDGFNWRSKLVISYRVASASPVFDKFSFQAMGEYESPEVIPQGKRKEQYAADFGIRKELLKSKAVVTFNINDIFNTRRWGSIYDTDEFYQDSYRRRDVRSFRLTISYKFGKSDFQLFKRNREEMEERGSEG